MFVENKSDILRQGDIVQKTYYLPANFSKLKEDQILLPQSPKMFYSYLVILSHCCELQWYTDDSGRFRPRRAQVLVAPLSLKMPFKHQTEEYRKLVGNGENTPDNDPIQYFYFEDNSIIGSESVVDFSTMMSIKSSLLREIGTEKLLELDVKNRHLLRIRLRDYFSRIPKEEWDEIQRLFPDQKTQRSI
jgi:hypothetical protein